MSLPAALKLTPTQVSVLTRMVPDEWHEAEMLFRNWKTRAVLRDRGFIEPDRKGLTILYWRVRLTDLGKLTQTALLEWEAEREEKSA